MVSRLRIPFGLAIVAAVTLMLELVLIRAFDVMMNAEMSHLIITCAMFSFGLSGVYASLRPLPATVAPDRYIAKLAIAFGAFALLLLPLLNLNPFNYSELASSLKAQLVYFAAMYVTLMVPFFLSGLIFTTVFSSYASQIRTLYSFDLCGAAIGCVAFIPFIPLIGPGGLLFPALGLSFVAAVLFWGRFERIQQALVAVALLVAVVPFFRTEGYFDFVEHENKRDVMWAKRHHKLETTRWDPVAKIEVINPRPQRGYSYAKNPTTGRFEELYKHVAYDGGEQSSRFYRFDGKYSHLRKQLEHDPHLFIDHFWNRSVAASHWFRADQKSDVLVVGSAGGQETKAALLYNPRSVDTVEMVRAVVELARNEYSDFIGNIFNDPRVHPHVGEGRTFLRKANKHFDIIQIFSNHTSSSMAAGGGAGRGVFLQTVEAYKEYFSSLKPDGILQVNHHIYPRLITTASVAWKQLGRTDFRKHVIVYERPGLDMIPLMLVKMTPWTPEEVSRLNDFMLAPGGGGTRDDFHLAEDPLHPEQSFLSDEFYSGTLSPELIARVPYRITPATDDQPYFNFLRKRFGSEEPDPKNFVNASTSGLLNAQLTDEGKARLPFNFPLDMAHYLVSGSVGLIFAVLFLIVPLAFGSARRQRWQGEFTSLFYFSCLGAAFITIELTLVPVFMKLVGIPLYTYSIVIFTVLLAAGIGSHAASELKVSPARRWWLPCVGVLLAGLVLLGSYSTVFEWLLAAPLRVRILAAGVMIFPIAFFMGMCLPLGILAIEKKPRTAIAWAWGMNGLFTTIGGLGATLVAMFFGQRATLLIALGIYCLAGLAFMRLRRFCELPAEDGVGPSVDAPSDLEQVPSRVSVA